MKKVFLSFCTVLCALIFSGCDSSSLFTIDEAPLVKMDKRFLGDWKVEEESDKKNFVRIQESVEPNKYHVQIWDRSGTNRTFEFNTFFSEVGGATFINVRNWTTNDWMHKEEYLLLKITDISAAYDKITAVVVSQPSVLHANSSAEVRAFLTRNVNSPGFYGATVHLNKVSKK